MCRRHLPKTLVPVALGPIQSISLQVTQKTRSKGGPHSQYHYRSRRELEATGLLVLLGALGTAEPGPATRARVQPKVAADGTERPRRLLRHRGLDAQRRRTTWIHAELVRLTQAQEKTDAEEARTEGRGRGEAIMF